MDEKALKDAVHMYRDKIKPPYNDLMDVVGFEGLCSLSEEFGGTYMYIPRKAGLFSGCIAEAVRNEYDGGNLRVLTRKYGLTSTTIRNILFGKR